MGKGSRAKFLNQEQTLDVIKKFIRENTGPFIDMSHWRESRAGGIFVKIQKMTLDGPKNIVSFYDKPPNKDVLLKGLSAQLERISNEEEIPSL